MQTFSQTSASRPLAYVADAWLGVLEVAERVKNERFSQYAREAMNFYDGPHNWMWENDYSRNSKGGGFLDTNSTVRKPVFRMTTNRVFEAVALFGPALFHKYPQVLVDPRRHPEIDPMVLGLDPADPNMAMAYQQFQQMQQMRLTQRTSHAKIRQHYLNWLQDESGKKEEARHAITEAVIKGMGVMWTEMFTPPGSQIKYPRSRYLNVDDLLVDPDAEHPSEVRWIARRCRHNTRDVAQKYGLDLKELRGHLQSGHMQATPEGRAAARNGKKHSQTFDICEYWEIYSKVGFGDDLLSLRDSRQPYRFDSFGPFTCIVVAKGIPYPLNLPDSALGTKPFEQLFTDVQWPIPFWTDPNCGHGWPFASLAFYFKPGCVWPVSLIKPAIGELRFVNWCLSFLADKVADCSMDYIVTTKAVAKELEEQFRKGDGPYKMLEIDLSSIGGPKASKVSDLINFLQAPQFNGDIWKMVEAMLEIIDRRTGITELLAGLGGQRQIRSAEEASIRNQNTQIRPDDMAEKTEQFITDSVKKEMIAAQWLCGRADVEPSIGAEAAWVWEQQIQTQDFDAVVRDFNYTIEAGSARKPNLVQRQQGLQELGRTMMPVFQAMAEAGQPALLNGFNRMYCETINVPPDGLMIPEPDPNAPQPPSPEEIKAQAELQKMEMEGQLKREEHDLKREEMELGMEIEVQKFQLEYQARQMELGFAQEEHEQELEHKEELAETQTKLAKTKARIAEKNARQKPKPAASKATSKAGSKV